MNTEIETVAHALGLECDQLSDGRLFLTKGVTKEDINLAVESNADLTYSVFEDADYAFGTILYVTVMHGDNEDDWVDVCLDIQNSNPNITLVETIT